MGGHGVHVHGNENNMKESDNEMLDKVQLMDTIKMNPNHFHMEFLNFANMYQILGGANTVAFGLIGAGISSAYYSGFASTQAKNAYAHSLRTIMRFKFGLLVGVAVGYNRFGDRQRMHNAYVAERLRRRYPESMNLSTHTDELWKLKGVTAPHDFYRWH
jgi:hypothetical protein